MTGWQTRATRTVYENAWIRVREDAVTRPDGSDGVYGVTAMKHPAVFVVPLTDAGEVVLVRMHRYPIDRESMCPPAARMGRSRWSLRSASCSRRPVAGP